MGLSESHGDAPEPVVEKISLLQQCMAAGGASIVSALVVNPLDVVKVQWAAVWGGHGCVGLFWRPCSYQRGGHFHVQDDGFSRGTHSGTDFAPVDIECSSNASLSLTLLQTRLQIQRSPTHSVSAYAQEHALLE